MENEFIEFLKSYAEHAAKNELKYEMDRRDLAALKGADFYDKERMDKINDFCEDSGHTMEYFEVCDMLPDEYRMILIEAREKAREKLFREKLGTSWIDYSSKTDEMEY